MRKWILVAVAAMAISIPSLAQNNHMDKDKSKSGSSTEQSSQKSMGKTDGAAEQQVKTIDNQYRQSALKNDASFAEKHVADDFMGVGSNGQLMTKDQVVQNRKEGKTKYDAIDVKDTKVRIYGNTAVIDHEAHVKGTGPDGPFDGDFRATLVWVKHGNDWKLVSFQSTPEKSTQAASKK